VSFLVEAYVARSGLDDARTAAGRARAAAEQLSLEGTPVRYVRTTFLPDDETCFHLIEAPSAEAVAELGRRAALCQPRIVAAFEESGGAMAAGMTHNRKERK
jgi:Protein of unknown function (DUF4242)